MAAQLKVEDLVEGATAARLAELAHNRPEAVTAVTFMQRHPRSAARPCWLKCDDEVVYVVKGQNAGRMIFNDHVIGLIGSHFGAPVPRTALVFIPEELIQNEPQMAGIPPGTAHGSEWVRNTSDKEWLSYTNEPYNRSRFAHLALLYGWLCARDHQLIYSIYDPHLVHSVDHGHFFPGGPNWTAQQLANGPEPIPYQEIQDQCHLLPIDIQAAPNALQEMTDDMILSAVAAPPDEWGVSMQEREAIATFILERRRALLEACNPQEGG